jgi:hypothetical protein
MNYPICRKCGSSHGIGMKNVQTGEIELLDICSTCLWEGHTFKFDPYLKLETKADWDKCLLYLKNE